MFLFDSEAIFYSASKTCEMLPSNFSVDLGSKFEATEGKQLNMDKQKTRQRGTS